MDSNDEPREEVKSKSWTEIIADQFSAVAWIKGLKIYLALFGIFSLLVYWSQPNPVCGVIGVILLIISYSLRVQESKVSSDSEEQSDSESAPSSSKIGDSLRSATGVLLLLVGWGYLLYSLTKSGPYNYETSVYTCHLMSLCAFRSFVLPIFIFLTLPLTGLVYWKRASFFRNMRSKMYAREMVRYSFAFIYFLIFIFILSYGFYGWYDTDISVTVVALMSVFFLATPLIMIFPKFTPTVDDSKDAEFITFFILFTFLHFASFILAIAYLGPYYKSPSIIPILLFIGSLMVVFFYYNYLLDFVKKTIGKSDGEIDNSYNLYRQERHTGSLLYIGIVSLVVGLVPNGLVFLLVLFIALFGISYFKYYTTGTSDWDTPLGKISKHEFTLIAFNICILLTFIYFVHDDIGEDNNQYYQTDCNSAKAGIYVRSYYDTYVLLDCDLSYRDLSGANLMYSRIADTSFNSTDLSGADFSFATLNNDVYFINANLHGASLYHVECDYWRSVGRSSCSVYFTDADLSEANLRGADLNGANLLGADFRGATLEGAYLGNSIIDANTLFSKNISGVNFEYVDFSYRNFSGYNLNGSSFSHAKLEGANLSGAYLVGVNFDSVNLSNRDFSGYDLSGASFNEADLSGVNLSETSLVGISAFNLLSCPSSLPTDWSCVGNNIIGPELSFTGINLNNANLSNANLYNSNFSSAVLTNTNLSNTNLSNSYFSYSNFDEINDAIDHYSWDSKNFTDWLRAIGFDGDFEDYLDKIKADSAADLSYADLSNANLSGVNLAYATLSHANLSNATLTQAELTGVTWYYTICPDGTNTGDSGNCSVS